MHEICKHVNFMFQFGIIIDYLFTFEKILFFSKYPVFEYLPKPRVNTPNIFNYPLGIYLPHSTIKDYFSLPLIDNVLDQLQQAMIFTSLNLKNVFFHADFDLQNRTLYLFHYI